MTANAIKEDGSPVRQAVVELIQDEIKNRRAEWRAIRTARGESRDQDLLDKLSKKVELKESQRSRVLELLSDERKRVRKARRSARENLDFSTMRETVKSIRSESDETVAEFLDAEQLEAWKGIRKERRGRRRWH